MPCDLMTADDLRVIVERHEQMAEARRLLDRLAVEQGMLVHTVPGEHEDRDALINLLRALAAATRVPWTHGRQRCPLCKCVLCEPDCPAAPLEALR